MSLLLPFDLLSMRLCISRNGLAHLRWLRHSRGKTPLRLIAALREEKPGVVDPVTEQPGSSPAVHHEKPGLLASLVYASQSLLV